jgi:hypothetical protein
MNGIDGIQGEGDVIMAEVGVEGDPVVNTALRQLLRFR